MNQALRYSGLLPFVLLCACATTSWQTMAPLSLANALRARTLLSARPALPTSYLMNATLVAFGEGERVRARVQLLVADHAQFRLTAFGPHGAALWVAASDGNELTAFDVSHGQAYSAPATREGLRKVARGLDVGMPIEAWLSLLAHHLDVPAEAVAYARPHGQVAWMWTPEGEPQWQILADEQGRIIAVRRPTADGGEVQATFLPRADGASPLAREVDVRVSGADGRAKSQLSLSIDEIAREAPTAAPGAFRARP